MVLQILVHSESQNLGNSHQQSCDINAGKSESCTICLDNYPITEMHSQPQCQHTFCKTCCSQHITSNLENLQTHIKCPEKGCSEHFLEATIKQLINPILFERLQHLLVLKKQKRDFDLKYCPKPGCSREFIPDAKKEYTVCACEAKICSLCCNMWHEGKTCLEAVDLDF